MLFELAGNDLAAAKLALFRLDPATAKLTAIGKVAAGAGEAYGVCFYRDTTGLYAFSVIKDGSVHQIALDVSGATPTGKIVRTMKLGTQSEGCAADERTGRLYVPEEDVSLWRFDAKAGGSTTPVKIAAADGLNLVADAEGVDQVRRVAHVAHEFPQLCEAETAAISHIKHHNHSANSSDWLLPLVT